MQFTFTQDQIELRDGVRAFLARHIHRGGTEGLAGVA